MYLTENDFPKGFEISEKLHSLIPGGAHTYSKGDDQFPLISPKAILRGKGAYVWDVDGHRFLDWTMGLTSVSLGHAYKPVLEAVRKELENGSNFQRPSYIELEMAEKMKEILPEMDMFKFAKNGSTVTTAAVKLARAYTGKKMVGVCAEHPFFSYDDWFIGTTECKRGIPEEIINLSFKFPYNDVEKTREIFEKYKDQVAAIILEPVKFDPPDEDYFRKLRELCDEYNVVLIIDEIVTGFKWGLPGAIRYFKDLKPDLTTYGKGIANGFSVAVLAGKKEIMELGGIKKKGMEKVFLVSTTHGAETHALRAAIKTIEIFQKEKVVDHIWKMGHMIRERIERLISKHGLDDYIRLIGYDCWLGMEFRNSKGEIDLSFKTFFLQEVIRRGILFQGLFTISYSHGEKELEFTEQVFDEALSEYEKALSKGSVEGLLVGEPVKPVFRKYV